MSRMYRSVGFSAHLVERRKLRGFDLPTAPDLDDAIVMVIGRSTPLLGSLANIIIIVTFACLMLL